MVVVTDTSPINYLILTGYVDVLSGVLLSPSGHGLNPLSGGLNDRGYAESCPCSQQTDRLSKNC